MLAKLRRWTLTSLAVFLPVALAFVRAQESSLSAQFREAARHIKRLSPAAFKELPAPIVKQLEGEGCTVPQEAFNLALRQDSKNELTNVIHGEFARKGQTDWAVLCSRQSKSSIRIFWGGPASCPNKMGTIEDTASLQGAGDSRIEYSRLIGAVNERVLRTYASPPPPGLMQHDAIEDAFAGKASTVYYCEKGKWKNVAGAD